MRNLKKIFRSVRYALKGFHSAYRRDQSFRLEVLWGGPIFLSIFALLSPLPATASLMLLLAYSLILTVELVNTAFERMLERVHPDVHELIGIAKDISAAAVLMTFGFAGVAVLTLMLEKFS